MKRALLKILLLGFFGLNIFRAVGQEYTFHLYSTRDGLPSSHVNALQFDQHGNLWVGTTAGIVRYNGHTFENFYSNPSYVPVSINALEVDDQDNIWIGSNTGLILYHQNNFSRFTLAGLDTLSIQYLMADQEQMIAATLHEVFIITRDISGYQTKKLDIPNSWSLSKGRESVLIGTTRNLWQWRDNTVTRLLPDSIYAMGGIAHAVETSEGILFGNVEDSLYFLPTGSRTPHSISLVGGVSDDLRRFINWAGSMWILNARDLSNIENAKKKLVRPPEDWQIRSMETCITDPDGNLWIGSTEGLILIRESLFQTIFPQQLYEEIYSVSNVGDSVLLIGGNHGKIFQYQPGKNLSLWEPPYPLGGEIMGIIKKSPQEYFIASLWKGILIFNNGILNHFSSEGISFLGPDILNIYEDQQKTVWIGANRGLFNVKRTNIGYQFHSFHEEGIPDFCDVFAFTESQNSLWIASSCGLYRFRNGGLENILLPDLDQNVQIRSIYSDNQYIWLGTIGFGLRYYQLDEQGLVLAGVINDPGATTLDITGDSSLLWAASTKGILQIDPKKNPVQYQSYTEADGFFSEGFTHIDLCLFQGKLMIAVPNGLKKFDPQIEIQNSLPKQITIEQFIVDDQPYPLNGEELFLPSNCKRIEIEFHYPELVNPETVRYRWKMDQSSTWTAWSNENKIVLFNPKSGNYHLQIKAQKSGSILNEAGIHFTVKKPWFTQSWFFLVVALICGLIVNTYFRRREKKFRLQQSLELERALMVASLESKLLRAQMNPHFLFNILNNLQEMILTGSSSLAQNYLGKFSRLMRMILNISFREWVKLEREKEFLSLYLDLEQLRIDGDFRYDILIEPELLLSEVPVFMIQPLVENAIKHGLLPKDGKKELRIEADETDDFIHIKVIDNGIGITGNKQRQDYARKEKEVRALDLLRNRLEILSQKSDIHYRLELRSLASGGVQASLYLPLFPVT